jgi:hypothetical protein
MVRINYHHHILSDLLFRELIQSLNIPRNQNPPSYELPNFPKSWSQLCHCLSMWRISSEVQGTESAEYFSSHSPKSLLRLISKFTISTTSHQHVRIAEARLEPPPGGLDGVKIQHPSRQNRVIVRGFFWTCCLLMAHEQYRRWRRCNRRIFCSCLILPTVQVRLLYYSLQQFLDLFRLVRESLYLSIKYRMLREG